jgi:hypothetical protein
MIEISYRKHGFIIRMGGRVDMEELDTFRFQLADEWAGTEGEFVLLVDARNFQTFTADAQAGFEEVLEAAREQGMIRISVLGISTALASLFCSIMVQTDLMDIYQFLDLSYETDWKNEMKSWLDTPFTPNT